jgi:hypothetical protein
MTTQTLPVGATKHHTEATLKARHEEASQLVEAWTSRVRSSGGNDRKAAEVQLGEALGWLEITAWDLESFRRLRCESRSLPGVSRPHGRSGVIGHG